MEKTRNEQKENLAGDRSEKEDGQKGNVDVVGESGSKYENKDKENLDYNKSHPWGQQETKRRDHHENKDKDDEDDIVYLSNEDIEDMLK
jgi:hypothetical protein